MAVETPRQCPICSGFDAAFLNSFSASDDFDTDAIRCECGRCGKYWLSRDLYEDEDGIRAGPEGKLLYISRLARERSGPKATALQLRWENWADFDERAGNVTAAAVYYERILLALAGRCQYPGVESPAHYFAATAARCQLPTGAAADIASQLAQAGLLRVSVGDVLRYRASPTIAGWQRVEELTLRRDPSRRAFVAMWFDASMDAAYRAIAAMLEAEGYRPPFRVDDPGHDRTPTADQRSKIDDRIIAEIRGSRFVIADFTGNRQAVYFEAGFAEGAGIPVLWSCKDGPDFKALNFDTRQHEHIKWKDESDLAAQLQAKIRRKGWSWTQ